MTFFDTLERCGLTTLLVLASVLAPAARADMIGDWNTVTQSVLAAEGRRDGLPYYALVHAAMYDAVNAIDGRFAVFAVRPAADARGASKEAAAAATAYGVLLGVFPAEAAELDAAYAESLATVQNGSPKTKGIALGKEVAAAWLELRAHGGRDSWAAAFVPAKAIGESTRLPSREPVEPFYSESATTFFTRNLRHFATTKELPLEANARLFAQVYVTQTGSMLVCRDVRGYTCLTTAFAESLRHFFATSYVDVTLTSSLPNGAPRVFRNTRELIAEVDALRRLGTGAGPVAVESSRAALDDDVVAASDVARGVAKSRFGLVSHR